jgi:hypothetical protein
MVKPSIDDELSEVELKDTPSMLAALDSEVTLMVSYYITKLLQSCDCHMTMQRGEVSQGEDEIKKAQEAKDEVTDGVCLECCGDV